MKKYLLIGFILGGIVIGSITGAVAYSYNASKIDYTPKDTNWNVNNVEDAIDELYNIHQKLSISDNALIDQSVKNDSVASKEYTATEEETVAVVLGATGKSRYSIDFTTTGTIIKDTGTAQAADSGFYRRLRTVIVHLKIGDSISIYCDGYVYGMSAYSIIHIK